MNKLLSTPGSYLGSLAHASLASRRQHVRSEISGIKRLMSHSLRQTTSRPQIQSCATYRSYLRRKPQQTSDMWQNLVNPRSINLLPVSTWRTIPTRSYGTQNPPTPIEDILDREIKDEISELSRNMASDQFPGFTTEAQDADVKLTKQCGNATVTVRFTVSSSLSEMPLEEDVKDPTSQEMPATQLVCMPDFQVQINKANSTLEISCYFEDMERDDDTGEQYGTEPVFAIDEMVLYHGEPKETEYAVSAEYFQDDLQESLMHYLAEHGINEEFGKNLVVFATSYEKKQYIGLMQRLKNFVTK